MPGLGLLCWGAGGAASSLSWCQAPCACWVLTFLAASLMTCLVSPTRKSSVFSCGKSPLARSCRAEKAGSLLGRKAPPGQKVGGSPERAYLAVVVDTEFELHSLVPTDVGVCLSPVAQHAHWKESAPGMNEHVCGAGQVSVQDQPQNPAGSVLCLVKGRVGQARVPQQMPRA